MAHWIENCFLLLISPLMIEWILWKVNASWCQNKSHFSSTRHISVWWSQQLHPTPASPSLFIISVAEILSGKMHIICEKLSTAPPLLGLVLNDFCCRSIADKVVNYGLNRLWLCQENTFPWTSLAWKKHFGLCYDVVWSKRDNLWVLNSLWHLGSWFLFRGG